MIDMYTIIILNYCNFGNFLLWKSAHTSQTWQNFQKCIIVWNFVLKIYIINFHTCNAPLRVLCICHFLYNFHFFQHTQLLEKTQLISYIHRNKECYQFWHTTSDDVFFLTQNCTYMPSENSTNKRRKYKKVILESIKLRNFQPFESVRFYLSFDIDIHHTRS
jgi:hypothetical protein